MLFKFKRITDGGLATLNFELTEITCQLTETLNHQDNPDLEHLTQLLRVLVSPHEVIVALYICRIPMGNRDELMNLLRIRKDLQYEERDLLEDYDKRKTS